MEGKSSKRSFNRAARTPRKRTIKRHYTHKQVLRKIDRYRSVAKTPKHIKKMHQIKRDYLKTHRNRDGGQLIRNVNYHMGIRAGLHSNTRLHDLQRGEKEREQRERTQAVAKAKQYYHRNYSLRKSFRDGKTRTRTITKESMTRT